MSFVSERLDSSPRVPRVLVLMATYNGAQYIAEQLDSILAQQGVAVSIRICDDCSSDNTLAICEDYVRAHEGVAVTKNPRNLGYIQNFMQMMYEPETRGYDYYALADQDDIWEPQKLSLAVEALSSLERRVDTKPPALYYSDAINFDETHEWSEVARYRACEEHPDTVLVRNWILGCTMVFNDELLALLAQYCPDEFPRIHDAWIHCIARYCGEVVADFDHAPIRHRITGQNAIGAPKDHITSIKSLASNLGGLLKKPDAAPTRTVRMLLEHYGDAMRPMAKETLTEFAGYRRTLRSRLRMAHRFDFYQPSWQGRLLVRLCFVFGRY